MSRHEIVIPSGLSREGSWFCLTPALRAVVCYRHFPTAHAVGYGPPRASRAKNPGVRPLLDAFRNLSLATYHFHAILSGQSFSFSTTTAVPYASTSVTPFMISVAS